MIIALMVVAVLLFVAVILLSNAFGSVATEKSIRAKIAAFDAAEAGINRAVEVLDQTHGRSTACSITADQQGAPALADGSEYRWCIEWNAIVLGRDRRQDHANPTNFIYVPTDTVYAWSEGTGAKGERGVTVEALIGRSTGLQEPAGAVIAGADIYVRGSVGIYESSPGALDAALRANGNIFEDGAPEVIEGGTFATGVDQVPGVGGTHGGSPSMHLPLSGEVQAAAGNASTSATGASPNAVPPPTRSQTFDGSLFVDGDVDLHRGLVTFANGGSVFIDGNLCIHDQARILNQGSVIWVTGTAAISGTTGGYSVGKGSNGMLIVLGADGGRPCAGSNGASAVEFDAETDENIGSIAAPYGSIDITGSHVVTGTVNAGENVYLDNVSGGGIQYDPKAVRPLPT